MSATAPAPAAPAAGTTPSTTTGLTPEARAVFVGLMLGMFVAGISQTIVSPAMPVIVAELGGMAHYSWLATAAMLASAVVVPVVGKLSDLYGRRPFYVGGLAVFLLGSALAGAAQDFWWLVGARTVQGLGMGALMTLSQTIIGDIIPPRQRGRYQGYMGAVFGVTSITGPLAGGWITDHLGWRWLFYATLPFGLVALGVIVRRLHLPHVQRRARIDVAGILTLTAGLVAVLLATSWGGTSYPWSSPTVVGLYLAGAALLSVFVAVELRAEEPVIPLRLFRDRVVTAANVAAFLVATGMFGAIFYIPVYAQGVLGVDATASGAIIVPMSASMIVVSIVVGLLITRWGRYKGFLVGGTVVLVAGFLLLTRMHHGSSQLQLTLAMVVVGVGLGAANQTYTLVVQNAVAREDLGVATAATQFFRSAGGTVGIAVLGTIMSSRLGPAITGHLPPAAADAVPEGSVDASSVLDPSALVGLPDVVVTAVRQGLGDALHGVFVAAVPLAVAAVVASALIPNRPLRTVLHSAPTAEPVAEAARTA
ncbi:MDR family MFS transporter [Cellulomonas carbonis]|uniref:MDR family MFS transporter n=1 Tax=Cellulomonas carbonis TaxID=1386092 RepID=UPI000A70F622|nr:MDR family MFS transporter [Cellulomonas carbonis]GGC13392.1 MFS transporter [Cellulomonas carbonis]